MIEREKLVFDYYDDDDDVKGLRALSTEFNSIEFNSVCVCTQKCVPDYDDDDDESVFRS